MVNHPVLVRGAGFGAPRAAPLILERSDQEFLPAVLEELRSESGRAGLLTQVAGNGAQPGVLRLFQPVHRVFHIVLVEVVCDVFGQPRLDASRIESSGLVIRRLGRDGRDGRAARGREIREGWMQSGTRIRGWVPFGGPGEEELDPEPARRRPELRAGHPSIDLRLARLGAPPEPFEERVSPLFVAPPEVCSAARRTLLYGLIPVTSTERNEAPAEPTAYPSATVRSLLPGLLRRGPTRQLPRRGQMLRSADAERAELATLVNDLEILMVGFDLFGESVPPRALFARLNRIRLPYADRVTTIPAGDFLREAAQILVNRDPSREIRMPEEWPAVDQTSEAAFVREVKTVLEARMASVAPQEGRFDRRGQQYRLRAFVRVRGENGCGMKLVWSDYSDRFTIVPWYESSAVSPVRISLPDADLDSLKKLKPNVAFVTPESVFRRIQGSKLGGLLEGKSGSGPAFGLDWICCFSIPIITLCAFIVLNLFLALLNIIFWWLPFVKVCLPFPRSQQEGNG